MNNPDNKASEAADKPLVLQATPVRTGRGRKLLASLLALALVIVGLLWWQGRSGADVHYTFAAVSRGNVTRSITSTGTVNPVLTIIVGTYVSGVIKQLYCDFNTQVKRGQVCAKIDPRPYQTIVDQDRANLAMARAQLNKDQANLAYSELIWRRNKGLLARGIVSQDSYDAALNAYTQARSQMELDRAVITQRSAELSAAEINLGYTDIVSPVDGIVVSRNVTMGQTVAASFQTPTLFLIATDLTRMQVDTNVSESDIGSVRLGQQAGFTVEAYPNHAFVGRVSQVRQAPQTVQNVVTYDVVLNVTNPALQLKPGMTATTRIVTAQRQNVLRVPDQALRYVPGGIAAATHRGSTKGPALSGQGQVWMLRNGRPVRVPVQLGLDDDSFTEVATGALKPGDQVIVSELAGTGAGSGTAAPRMFRF